MVVSMMAHKASIEHFGSAQSAVVQLRLLQYLVGCLKLVTFALVLMCSYLFLKGPLLLSKLGSGYKANGLLTYCSLKRLRETQKVSKHC